MNIDVAIIDYGIGNIFSVRRALEYCGAKVSVSNDPGILLAAPRLVLPGVGAFADGMRGLKKRGLDNVILEYVQSGKSLLGICLGMQMFATSSEEFGEHAGLNVIPGRVIPIPNKTVKGDFHKIPYVGWAGLEYPERLMRWDNSILSEVCPADSVYFLHSFEFKPYNTKNRLADYKYDGRLINAAVRKDNVFGTQFHPEKSGRVGLKILNRFLSL